MNKNHLFSLVGLTFLVVGCDEPVLKLSGSLPGKLSVVKTTDKAKRENANTLVTVRGFKIDQQNFGIDILERDLSKTLYAFKIKGESPSKIQLHSQIFVPKGFISLQVQDSCGEYAAESLKVKACLSEESIYFAIDAQTEKGPWQLFVHAAKNFDDSDGMQTEYSLDTLVKSVKKFTYETNIRREVVFQGNQNIALARANLLPRLNLKVLLEGPKALFSLPEALSSFLPFVFPNRWYELDRTKALYQAERYSYAVLLSQQVSTAANFYFTISHYELALKEMRGFLTTLETTYRRVHDAVEGGFEDPNEAAIVGNRLSKLKSDVLSLEDDLRQQYASLSRFLGRPIQTPISIELPSLPSDPTIPEIDVFQVTKQAEEKSLELKQMDLLIEAAKKHSKGVTFSFFDPGAIGGWEIGFDKIPRIEIAQSETRRLEAEKGLVGRVLGEEVEKFASIADRVLKQAPIVKSALVNSEKTVRRELDHLNSGEDFNASHFVDRFEELLGWKQAQVQVALLSFIMKNKLEKLLTEGHYENLLAVVPEGKPIQKKGK